VALDYWLEVAMKRLVIVLALALTLAACGSKPHSPAVCRAAEDLVNATEDLADSMGVRTDELTYDIQMDYSRAKQTWYECISQKVEW